MLEDFSIQVPKGKIFAIMGGNGSGKSTALKVIMGIYKARRGESKGKWQDTISRTESAESFLLSLRWRRS